MSTILPTSGKLTAQARAESISPGPWQLRERVESSSALSGLCAVLDQAMISGTNFVTAVIIGRSCGAESLGLHALIASAIAMIVGIQDQLITAPYVVYHNRRHGRSLNRYAGGILTHQVIFIVAALIITSVCLRGAGNLTAEANTVGLVLLCATPGILLRAFIREMALAHYDIVTVLLVDFAVCGAQLSIVLALMLTGSVNLTSIYGVIGTACLLTVSVWGLRHRQLFAFDRQAIRVSWARNWRFGRWALATHLAGCSTPYVMPWVLFALKGERETGLLAACSVIVGVANILLSGMADFLTPRAARAYTNGGIIELRRVLRGMMGLSTAAIGSVCIIAILFGQQIVDILYDGKFDGIGLLVSLLTLSVLANAIGNGAGNGLWALDRPRSNFVADMLTLIVAIASAPILILPYGATGAAMSTLIACSMGAVFRQLIFHQCARQVDQ